MLFVGIPLSKLRVSSTVLVRRCNRVCCLLVFYCQIFELHTKIGCECFNLYYWGGGGGGILLLRLLELSVFGVKRWSDMFGCVL